MLPRANLMLPHANLRPTLGRPHANLLPSLGRPHANPCQPGANLVPPHANLVPPHANLMLTSCQPLGSKVGHRERGRGGSRGEGQGEGAGVRGQSAGCLGGWHGAGPGGQTGRVKLISNENL